MAVSPTSTSSALIDERGPASFRTLFGNFLSRSQTIETAILNVRLSAVDLSAQELEGLQRLRVLVAGADAQTVEGEAYALAMDPMKRENLSRLLGLLQTGVMEIRLAPLGGWSPDFSVFSDDEGPQSLLLGLHWFHRPFPYRGPAWAAHFGPEEASRAHLRFQELWAGSHNIGPAVRKLMERAPLPEPPRDATPSR